MPYRKAFIAVDLETTHLDAREGKIIEYQDAAIAATFKITGADYLITLNKQHFERIPDIKGKIIEPKELRKIMK